MEAHYGEAVATQHVTYNCIQSSFRASVRITLHTVARVYVTSEQ